MLFVSGERLFGFLEMCGDVFTAHLNAVVYAIIGNLSRDAVAINGRHSTDSVVS